MKPFTILALTLALGLTEGPALADVVLINTFEVPKGQREATITAWEAARDFLAEQPGYISTELHGSVTQQARFELVNVARWESAQAFMAATEEMRAAGVFQPPADVIANPALYTVIAAD
ncbi:MAG: antibiotic biosynthesis monooxygenase family protein [Dinoroseobacter sp.]|nr:antibiotic biosynthesis monooxygenase family protein [Dinoroseobacter sp.]